MRSHVELDRRFRELTAEEREDPSLLVTWGDQEPFRGTPWPELLESERVVILAEAGSGKTQEMQAQVKRLISEGKSAFFVPIEALDKEDLPGYLAMEAGEDQRFATWLSDSAQIAWLFLDAVDELKLTNGKLEMALGKIVRALGSACCRARVLLSCRPSDWRPVQDLEIFKTKLPISKSKPVSELAGDDAFLAPFRALKREAENDTKQPVEKFRCVVMLPLSRRQIEVFASEHGVTNPKALTKEIDRHEAWSFARRPLDLKGLIEIWKSTGAIGTRLQQHEIDIESTLRDNADRSDQGVLSLEKAHEGAERLALAMLLTKTRTIRAPEEVSLHSTDMSSLDASSILSDWTEAQVKALLRRPIFDPATYGRVRFHHRSVQEFLAARRLGKLREGGLTKRKLRSLIFAETYGERVVIPSMRPVAAWLSHTDADICREVLDREPEALVLFGDPETLSIDVRAGLIRNYVAAYSGGSWRGLEMPIAEMQRLASADLAHEIRRAWNQPHTNEEIPEFLLKLIWLGAIQDCADIALDALLDADLGPYARILSARALTGCNRTDLLRTAVDDMLTRPNRWPDRVVFSVAPELFPDVMTAAELRELIQRTREPKQTVGGFSWELYNRADEIAPGSEAAVSLRNMLSGLLWDGKEAPSKWYQPANRFSYLTPALARLCAAEIARSGEIDPNLVHCSVLAHCFHDNKARGRDDVRALTELFADNPGLREMAFWIEVEVMEAIEQRPVSHERVYRLRQNSLLGDFVSDDWIWLLRGLRKSTIQGGREVALRLLVELWHRRGGSNRDLSSLRRAVAKDPPLSVIFGELTSPRPPDPSIEKWKRHERTSAARQASKRDQVEKSWADWKRKADADPLACFGADRRSHSMWVLLDWLTAAEDSHSYLAHQNWREVRRVLGDAIANGFEATLREYWRNEIPRVWSKRAPADRNLIFATQSAALTGLAVEVSTGVSWAAKFTRKEARRAAEWALTELNGLPDWFEILAKAQPKDVCAAIEVELKAELTQATVVAHPHTLNALRYGGQEARRLAITYLRQALLRWPRAPRDKSKEDIYIQNLDTTLSIIVMEGKGDQAVADLCEERFLSRSSRASSTVWLQGLCACDLSRGASALRAALKASRADKRRAKAVGWFSALFGDRDRYKVPIALDGDAKLLMELTRMAYEHVRRQDDIQHEGTFSPGVRDEAESGRNRLLGALIGKPGPGTHSALRALAGDSLFAHMSDRLTRLARERAANDSELPSLSPVACRNWSRRFETPPRNRDELFHVMLDRLDDIEHDVRHHDFSDRRFLASIANETDMQPLLARKFSDAARGHYQVVREDEVVDKKETDIRLLASACTDRCVIEIKIGDRCTITQLERAIEDQLVGQYLRHANCSAGCLLVTYAGRKGFEDPVTGRPQSFEDVMARLASYAMSLETAEQGRIRLAVFGLDLRSPANEQSDGGAR